MILYNMYKPINFIPVYSQKLRYMSNDLLELKKLYAIKWKFGKFSGLLPND